MATAGEQTAPPGAPAERIDAPVPDAPRRAPQAQVFRNLERYPEPPPEIWQDPVYSQTHDSTYNMYTPGIYVDERRPRKQNAAKPARMAKESSARVGGFLRAVCLVLVCAIISGATAYGAMEYRFRKGDFTVVNQVVIGGAQETPQSAGLSAPVNSSGDGMAAVDIYTMACTQVVSITTELESSGDLFGGIMPGATSAVTGSGFIISSDGYILTNYHVVEMAYQYDLPLVVCLNDGTEYAADIIGYEVNNDIALIKVDATGLNPAVIADSDNISVGQLVYAIGNPFGELVYTMTDGIVSALDRVVSVEGKSINTFQFSAAVNSGNSGGPVYNTNGEVIGIVTAKPMRSSVEGIGFAIPINDAIQIAAELIEHGYITGRPLMGITVQTVSSANAEFYGWVVGAYVRSVSPDSAAEKAGIQFGDIIIKLDDTEIASRDELVFAMRRYKAGDTTTLVVWRGGEELEITITFDEDLTAGQPRQQAQPSQPPQEYIIRPSQTP